LHVLSLPPAFVLSQDQTLKLKDLISTKSLRKLTECHPLQVSPERWYSPKHRLGRCRLDNPKIVRKDTAAYASLSRLHLSKSTRLNRDAKTAGPAPPRPEPSAQADTRPRKDRRQPHQEPAADEPDISSPPSPVNPSSPTNRRRREASKDQDQRASKPPRS
jgi:hypothetical protein